ncbi:MAG: hypothetical protein ACOYYU_16785 [Chloroflexota bacterium]
MKREYLPYYFSRFALSAVFSVLVWSVSWKAALMTIVFFGLFLLYLHSGWFSVDLRNPFFPLRRDAHGQEVQRKALIIAIVLGLLLFTASIPLSGFMGIPLISGQVALSIGILAYFVVQFALFLKA